MDFLYLKRELKKLQLLQNIAIKKLEVLTILLKKLQKNLKIYTKNMRKVKIQII